VLWTELTRVSEVNIACRPYISIQYVEPNAMQDVQFVDIE